MRLVLIVLLLAAAAGPSHAQDRTKATEARERLNRKWDQQINRMLRARIEAECKAEAKKAYWAIRFNKRRQFVEECISKAAAPTATPAAHQVY